MPRVARLVCALWVLGGIVVLAADPPKIAPEEVGAHIGKRVTVCGTVVDTRAVAAPRQGGKQYFLHFGPLTATPPFVVVVVGNDLAAGGVFHDIDKRVAQKEVCATGYVKSTGTSVQMRVDAPNQLKIVKTPTEH